VQAQPGRKETGRDRDRGRELRVAPRPRRWIRRLSLGFAMVTAGFVLAALFGLAAFHNLLAQGQYELEGLGEQIELAQRHELQLRIEAERLVSPGRIAEGAETMGLVIPQEVTDLTVTTEEPGSTVPNGEAITSDSESTRP
jgi:hypothetical protein